MNLPKHYCYADIWSKAALFALEHLLWHLRESPTAMKEMVRSMFRPLPKEDYARNRFAALRERFEPRKAEQGDLAITA